MIQTVLIVVVVAFVGYALYTQYTKTPTDESVPKRVWTALVAAAGVLGAVVTNWLHSGTTP